LGVAIIAQVLKFIVVLIFLIVTNSVTR